MRTCMPGGDRQTHTHTHTDCNSLLCGASNSPVRASRSPALRLAAVARPPSPRGIPNLPHNYNAHAHASHTHMCTHTHIHTYKYLCTHANGFLSWASHALCEMKTTLRPSGLGFTMSTVSQMRAATFLAVGWPTGELSATTTTRTHTQHTPTQESMSQRCVHTCTTRHRVSPPPPKPGTSSRIVMKFGSR